MLFGGSPKAGVKPSPLMLRAQVRGFGGTLHVVQPWYNTNTQLSIVAPSTIQTFRRSRPLVRHHAMTLQLIRATCDGEHHAPYIDNWRISSSPTDNLFDQAIDAPNATPAFRSCRKEGRGRKNERRQ